MQKLGGVSGSWVCVLGLGWLVCCGVLAGCDGTTDDDGGAPSSGPVGVDDFAARFAARYCGSIGPCCDRFDESFDLGDCRTVTESYVRTALQGQLDTLKIVFDESIAGQCIDAYGRALEACTDRDESEAIDTACIGLLRGTVPLGAACNEAIECERSDGQYVLCSTGVCTLDDFFSLYDAPHATLGEACEGTCASYSDGGSSCNGSGTSASGKACWLDDGLMCVNGTCAAAPTLGEACSADCAGGSHCLSGTCVASMATGPCPRGNECVESSFCNYDAATPECVPRRADGEACDSSEECLGGDCEGDRCRKWSVASRESCAGLFDD
jgi:hypothetical protein